MGELADWSGLSTAQLKTIFRGDGLEAIPAVDDLEGLVLGVDMLRPSDESAAARVASWAADIRDGRGRRGLDEIEAVTNLDRSFLKSIESGKGLLVVARLADLLVSLERNGIKVSNGFKSMADEAFEWFALRGFSDK
ncbi:MAG TPA: hypothetical protein VHC22_33945 [Pirellulales bacterium]|nr:hypothetical protein [Pirellulales bacterium]